MTTQSGATSTSTSTEANADALQLRRVITDLLTVCASMAAQHAPNGSWTPASSGTDAFAEASSVIETLSRSLNQTRRDLRKLSRQARRSAHSGSPPYLREPRSAPSSGPPPVGALLDERPPDAPACGDA
ncbi:hypothetical protein ACWD1Z_35255 [Streptomyces sp. NPDC002784]